MYGFGKFGTIQPLLWGVRPWETVGKIYTLASGTTAFSVHFIFFKPPGSSKWIISVGDYVDNSFTALGSSNPREVRLELWPFFYVFHFRFVQVHFVFC